MNDQRHVQTTPVGDNERAPDAFNPDEWHALNTIRERYHPDYDLFTPAELAHLRFMRWLHTVDQQAA